MKQLSTAQDDHGIQSHHFMANRWRNNGNSDRLLFSWAPKSLQMVTAAMKLKDTCSLKSCDQRRQHTKKQRHYLANKGLSSQIYGFSSGHVWMWKLDHKESWGLENWCFWTVVLEKTPESPLDCKEIKPVNSKENQSWIFIGRTDAGAEAPILWQPDRNKWLIWKDPDAGKDWVQEEKGTTEDEMAAWHHQLNGHGFGRLRELVMDREAWRAMVHGGRKELEMTEGQNWTELRPRLCPLLHNRCSIIFSNIY